MKDYKFLRIIEEKDIFPGGTVAFKTKFSERGQAMTKDEFNKYAMNLYEFTEYPAVKYKILFSLFDVPYEDEKLIELRKDFLKSDIVEEMAQTQDIHGGWGKLRSKDYSVKAKIPTSQTGINRCLYIGLTIEDRDILFMANEYLLSFLDGTNEEKLYDKNERANPWQMAEICNLIEAIQPNTPECDEIYNQWLYIANRAYESGEYSYEADRAAQHEVFFTREDRLVPMQSELLLKRRELLGPEIENAMLRHLGGLANQTGYFWDKIPSKLPEDFKNNKMRRWFHTFNYINQFQGSELYLKDAVDWLQEQIGENGLWDWGTQTKDPWGYFGYFSCNRHYQHNRVVDCTMEILSFMKKYLDNN